MPCARLFPRSPLRRQDIDEAQGLHPEALVLHDPLEQALEPSINGPCALGLAAYRRQ
jgi:hypothetical protein